ncbi:MAG TPA: S41 family peptidase [Syntrophobacteraceae bacterium]|nr:S41 family peptidase [Syntrophobacteraceae bacterium]
MKQFVFTVSLMFLSASSFAGMRQGYYRFPAIHGDKIVFTSEGDLWVVGISGGTAARLTTSEGTESHAMVSPDGSTIAFSGQYEGPTEVYTMPFDGGVPKRITYEGQNATVVGWTADGKILYTTTHYSTLPNVQMVLIDPASGVKTIVPLEQASDGTFNKSSDTLFFTRLPFQGSHTKRYKGGTAQNIWRYVKGTQEAVPLTGDYAGTSKDPMLWNGRVYFLSDRDGTMNIWSMNEDGKDQKQETFQKGFDDASATLSDGKIVYQSGADIYLYDIASRSDNIVPIQLTSDFDQEMTTWVKKPMDYLTTVNISPDGDRVVLTARGQVFVAPVGEGRFVEVTRKSGVRYRNAKFSLDGKSLILQSDQTGEAEFWKYAANGVGPGVQLTRDGKGFRMDGTPSPDGKLIAYTDKKDRLLLFNTDTKEATVIATSQIGGYYSLRWSPDSKWLAYVSPAAANTYGQIVVYNVTGKNFITLTDDRTDSDDPTWSPDGKWLYFLSDRNFQSLVESPWGTLQPEPYFANRTKIYAIALVKDLRFPFAPPDELHAAQKPGDEKKDISKDKKERTPETKAVEVKIDTSGIQGRVYEVPIAAGEYSNLAMNDKALFLTETPVAAERKTKLDAIEITNKDVPVKSIVEDIRGYDLSADGKKIVLRKGEGIYVVDASTTPITELSKNAINLSKWMFSFDPREEWRQMFIEAWRLERDFFYDPGMQGVDYEKTLDRYLPLVSRVRDRDELNDLISQIVGELSALHTFVVGGDVRKESQEVAVASLGAELVRDSQQGGYRVVHIYKAEPDYLDVSSPLAKPGSEISEGDIIMSINGVSVDSAASPDELLENQADRQVLLHLKSGTTGKEYDAIVVPISQRAGSNLRYLEWENARRLIVDKESNNSIGYVHLRAMGGGDIAQWAKEFYPVFAREGLIVDVRHNNGGNIDSWILEKLMRKAWMYWKERAGAPTWNMQYAFRGHIVVLCDQNTASDGEAFTEGFRRLGLGKVIGMRTWGGEIWLSFDNFLLDNGIASAAEVGVYGPEGKWLIEGHGVDPDIVVDDPPHETFDGQDAQLQAAINYLKQEIKDHPVQIPPPPAYPEKAIHYK